MYVVDLLAQEKEVLLDPISALNIKLLESLAQGASRFEKSLAPPKNPLAPNFFQTT